MRHSQPHCSVLADWMIVRHMKTCEFGRCLEQTTQLRVFSEPKDMQVSETTHMQALQRSDQKGTLTFSSMKLRQPSLGTKAAIFFPFLISCTRAHFRIAELGCLASIPLRAKTTQMLESAIRQTLA